jgi:hypothetical protein
MQSRKAGPSDEYLALLRGEMSPDEYFASIRQRPSVREEYAKMMGLSPGRSRRRDHGWEFAVVLGFALIVATLVTYWIVR